MKKNRTLILAAALALALTGCFGGEEPETVPVTEAPVVTEAPTEVPAEAPTEAVAAETTQPATLPEKEYADTIGVAILVEGEPDKLLMDLFDGGSYVIYIPQEDWEVETSVKDSFLTDRWSRVGFPEVWMEIVSYGDMTVEEVEDVFRAKGYNMDIDPETGYYIVAAPDFKTYRSVEIMTDGQSTFSMETEMPVEFGDGMAPRFRAMRESFEIK